MFRNETEQGTSGIQTIFLEFLFSIFILFSVIGLVFISRPHDETSEWLIYIFTSVFSFIGLVVVNYVIARKNEIPKQLQAFFLDLPQVVIVNLLGMILVISFFAENLKSLAVSKLFLLTLFLILANFCAFAIKPDFKLGIKLSDRLIRSFFIISPFLIFVWMIRPIDYHHCSFYVGPVFDVLKGKSLLHDTPSQYGYLNIMLLASFFKIFNLSMAGFSIVDTFLYTIYYILALTILYKLLKGRYFTICGVITLSTVTLFSKWNESLYPSAGPLRFGLGMLVCWAIFYLPRKYHIYIGSILTGMALFWSAETSIYIVPAWIFYLIVVAIDNRSFKNFLVHITYLAITVLLLFSILSGIEFFRMKQFPNWSNFYDYALTYSGGFGSLPMPLIGNYYFVVVIMVLGLVTTVFFVGNNKTNAFYALAFLCIHNVAIFSYFVSRSHYNNVVNILVFYIIELILIYRILRTSFKFTEAGFSRYFKMPVVTFCLMFFIFSFVSIPQTVSTVGKGIKEHYSLFSEGSPYLLPAIKEYVKSNDIIVLSKDTSVCLDTQILLGLDKKNTIPFNPYVMTTLLPGWPEKYFFSAVNNIRIGTNIITDGSFPEVMNYISQYYELQDTQIKEKQFVVYKVVGMR